MSAILFKTKRALERAFLMHPICIMILGEMAWWTLQRKLPFVITETGTTKEEDDAINRLHAVHRQFRGFDIRITGWTEKDINDFESYFEKKFGQYAALSSDSGLKNLIVVHKGTARHIHVQISAQFAIVGVNLKGVIYENEF